MKLSELHFGRHPDPVVRRSIRVLRMVTELHVAGYQRLRVMTHLYGTGAWRCRIAPASVFFRVHGGIIRDTGFYPYVRSAPQDGISDASANYTSAGASESAYFDWTDATGDNARKLAVKFVERFGALCDLGQGWDYAYAGWLQRAVGLAERGWLPSMFDERTPPLVNSVSLLDMRPDDWKRGSDEKPVLPPPPPGELLLEQSP